MLAISGVAYAAAVARANAEAKADCLSRPGSGCPRRGAVHPRLARGTNVTYTPTATAGLGAERRPAQLRHPPVEILGGCEAEHSLRPFGRREDVPDIPLA